VPNFKLYGGCVHQGHGPLGAASLDGAEWRKARRLKALGYNAVRTAHNPPASAFLDACDALGLLVMTELADTWAGGKNANDYHRWFAEWHGYDLQQMVRQARSHPAVIMYSIGNEIPSIWGGAAPVTARNLTAAVHAADDHAASQRAVTAAIPNENDNMAQLDAVTVWLDAVGYNYGQASHFAEDHARLPDRVVVGTESKARNSFRSWTAVWNASTPYVIGDFVWTALDYVGESVRTLAARFMID